MAKMTKIMTPGFDTTGPGFVLRQHRLPHRSLQTTTPGHMTAKHATLTFHQLMNGFLSVALLDTPSHKLDPELANKLSFQQFLISMSFHYAHKDILQACNTFIWSWEMREFEWSDPWPQLEERLKSIRRGGRRERWWEPQEAARRQTHQRRPDFVHEGQQHLHQIQYK